MRRPLWSTNVTVAASLKAWAGARSPRLETVGQLRVDTARFARKVPGAFGEPAGGVDLVEQVLDVDLQFPGIPLRLPADVEDGVRLDALALQADPLAEIVTSDDVRGMWESITTARRRAILGALVHHVEIGRVGKGVRVLTVEAAEATVTMGWRRADHRVSLTRARSLVSITPRVPDDARDIIAAALSA